MTSSTQNKPDNPFFSLPLAVLTRSCCRCPLTVLFIAAVIAAAALYAAAHHLTMKMSRLDLINPKSGFNQLWLEYVNEFGDSSEVIIAAQGQNNKELAGLFDELTKQIKDQPQLFQSVLGGIDLSKLQSKGLHYVPLEDIKQIRQSLHRPQGGMTGTNQSLAKLTSVLSENNIDKNSAEFGKHNYFIFPVKNDAFPPKNGFFGFILLKLKDIDKTQFSQGTQPIAQLRSMIAEVRKKYPNSVIGLTGMPVLENDEMALSNEAMTRATLLAFAGVTLVFIAGFGSLRYPFFAVLGLAAAFAWTMGYITFAVGHLNILSIAFGAMLIGLGTDFSVHYLARFLDLRRMALPVEDALVEAAGAVGPGILTGALTTSAAFYAASFAEFTGIAELGTIAGGGILLCAAATFTVFPAFIVLFAPQEMPAQQRNIQHGAYQQHSGQAKRQLYNVKPLIMPFFWFPKLTLFLFVIGFAALCCGIPKVWYDYNLLNLQPEGLESVEWERKLLEQDVNEGGKNIWFALSIAETKEELRERKKRFAERYPELTVEEIVSLLPDENEEKRQLIQDIHEESAKRTHLSPLYAQLYAVSDPEPPTEKDLPEPLVERFIGRHGQHLMRVYTTANIWDMAQLEKFVESVRDIDPKATGSPLQTYESSLQMQQGFITAAYYAFGVIFVLLLLDFRSLGDSLAALIPTVLGMTMMFGTIGWLNLPLNPANMIVLPLIMGIGIDNGVYLIHDFRNQNNRSINNGNKKRGGYELSPSTASAVVITTLTTMIGFGTMMAASHRGLQSLGRVFVIGTACCLFTSLIVLPILLCSRKLDNGKKTLPQIENRENSVQTIGGVTYNGTIQSGEPAEKKRLVKRKESV
ncbi:MAG: MMPL family transporter [Planctomycetaceae bacterium]|jgi:predicted RND superfamily exporter protein|nr:MMPL family transporter [Planctomycetaceae bacterium]